MKRDTVSPQTESNRADAEDAISSVLQAMSDRDMDAWESDALSHAIIAFRQGAYRLARVDADAATLRVDRRSPAFRAVWSHTKECLARQWANARPEPTLVYPAFGAIERLCWCKTNFGWMSAR